MYQQITIIGRLGKSPAMRYTQDGSPVTSFSVATDKRWTDGQGQQQQRTVWFNVSAWKRLAEVVNQYAFKGMLVMVVGEMQPARTWVGKDGETRASLDVRAQTVKFLSRAKEATEGQPVQPGQTGENQTAGATGEAGEDAVEPAAAGTVADEERIPF